MKSNEKEKNVNIDDVAITLEVDSEVILDEMEPYNQFVYRDRLREMFRKHGAWHVSYELEYLQICSRLREYLSWGIT